jgi:hypothetical protein
VPRKTFISALLAGLAAALAGTAPATAAVAPSGGSPLPPPGRGPEILLPPAAAGVIHPGEVIELRWRGVPRGAEEMELLLSLDGGRTYAVRVTPDLDTDRGAFSWRVPPFPSRQARLAMRINLAGREVFAGLSAPFRIAPDRRAAPWTMRAHGGDLWLGGPEGAAAADVGRELTAGAPRPRISPLWPSLAAVAPDSPRPARSRTAIASACRSSSCALTSRSPAPHAPPPVPLDLPLRI